jgi:3alpha(or 20beta)-hydroxysteroid dehydrogenase
MGEVVNRLDNKVAIVTGGRSGIGAAVVRRFRGEGAKVVVADIDAVAAARVATEATPQSLAVNHDVRDEASWTALITHIEL